ncbi:MAG: helix-turn-helix transcriptional regulator [Bacteroidota bacterium]|jgi:transcriptional regulator with XRE-family HTH domain|nr:helix-turn-helix transcriptional regulator [Bacteroidota bacterium]
MKLDIEKIDRRRVEIGLSKTDLAKQLNWSRTYLYRVFKGEDIALSRVELIASVLRIPPKDLLI